MLIRRVAFSAITNLLQRRGYDVIRRDSLNGSLNDDEGIMAKHLQQLFHRLNIDCVLDVGANAGQYRDLLRTRVGYSGRIISFEPVPALAVRLKARSAEDNWWTVCPVAIGSQDGEFIINVAAESMHSSFLTIDQTAVEDFKDVYREIGHERVPMMRLDSAMKEYAEGHSMHNIYLKMDTQGYDLEVIKGAPHTLESVLGLQSEISVLRTYAGMPDGITAIRTLKREGFDISGMYAVARDRRLRVIQFDCVMVKKIISASHNE